MGQKPPLRLKEIWAIRVRLQVSKRTRDLALFNLAIDSKLRACDLKNLRVRDVAHGTQIAAHAMVMQQKTPPPVQFEVTEQTRDSVSAWIANAELRLDQYHFPSRVGTSPHLSTRQYSRTVASRIGSIGLAAASYGTHTMHRTEATLIHRRTKNLRAVQLLLGHTTLESTIRCLGIEVDDAPEIAEQTEIWPKAARADGRRPPNHCQRSSSIGAWPCRPALAGSGGARLRLRRAAARDSRAAATHAPRPLRCAKQERFSWCAPMPTRD
ncbi:MAG: tyrosine-type recombinase/integrase [Betaproteobacteria bacterium]|nr:tyrosine-type recombinase/integrase [Betaproteobacteria bacterium]